MRVTFFALLAITLCFTPFALAQVPDPAVSTAAPIPGAGHHYIGVGSETVSPADGLLTFNLPISLPAGRQLSLPFGFRYSSSEQFYLSNNSNDTATAYLNYKTRPAMPWEVNGWSYDLPMLSGTARIFGHWQTPVGSPPTSYIDHQCDVTQNFSFRGFDGAQYTLGLGSQFVDPTYANGTNCYTVPATSSWAFHGISATFPSNDTTVAIAPPVTVFDQSGTSYYFPEGYSITTGPGSDGPVWQYLPQTITDRNGNQISLKNTTYTGNNLQTPANGYNDTLGRTAVSWTGIGNNGDTVSISGLSTNITLHWTSVPVTFPETFHNVAGTVTCQGASTPSTSINVVSEIDLPNGQKYAFTYDSTYGRVSKITFPTGGYVRYVWGLNTSSAAAYFVTQVPAGQGNATYYCDAVYDNPAVTDRYVSYDGSTEVLHQHFAYSTVWNSSTPYVWNSKSTTVTSTDLLTNQVNVTAYNYGSVIADQGGPYDFQLGNNVPRQVPVEQSVLYQDGSGHTFKTVNKTWMNSFSMVGEQTILDNGQGMTSLRCYDANEQVANVYEYGFQSEGSKPADPSCASSSGLTTSAIGPLKRQAITVYHNFLAGSPSTHIVNEADSTTVYDGSGNQVRQTTYTYDGGSVTASGAQTGLVSPPGLRGNVTSATQWLNVGGTSPNTTYTYYDTGQVYQKTDACGNTTCSDMTGTNHATTYSYADNYASGTGTPPGQTNAYLTQITLPNTGVAHIAKFTWGYNDGLIRSSVDQNSLTSSFAYADPWLRLTQVNTPDGGQTAYAYNDTPPSPTITTTKKINSSQSLVTVSVMDGLGHAKQSQLTSDPQGTIYTDTTYDGFGRVWKQSSPHRSSYSPTDGTTRNSYDALGRTVQVIPPDSNGYSNLVSTQYSGNCTVVTDQSLRARKSCTDSLGRLSEVDEPSAPLSISYPVPGTGSVAIGGSERDYWFDPCAQAGHGSCPTQIPDTGYVSVTVNGFNASYNYSYGDTPTTVAAGLASALSGSSSPVAASANGSLVTLTATSAGPSTNYSLSTSCNTTNSTYYSGCSFSGSPSGSTLTGGANGNPAPLNFPSPYVTLYTYDTNNNLLTVNQQGGSTNSSQWRTRTFTHDSLSRLLCSSNPENSSAACPATATSTYTTGTVGYTYDANGNVSTKEDARAITTTYGYDLLNREITTTYSNSDPTITTTYDQSNCLSLPQCQNIGHRTSMTDAAGSELWAYDVPDRVHREQRTTNTIQKTTTYTLDYAGNVVSAVYPTNRTVSYTFDSANRPSVATDSANGITYAQGNCANGVGSGNNGVCYAPQGAPTFAQIGVSTSLPAGLNLTDSYNNRLQPVELKASSTGGNALDLTYSFVDPPSSGNAGRVYSITNNIDSTRSQTFTYDQLNRIAAAQTTSTHATSSTHCWGETYTIDPWSNLTSIAATTNSNYTGCTEESGFTKNADGNNHLSGFSYDFSGNTQSDGVVASYVWDAESQLKSATNNGLTTTYTYDGDGRRVAKVGSKLYWYGSGGEILAETNASGATTNEYVYFGGKRVALLPSGGTAQFYAEDFLATSRVVTTNTGVVCYDADFYPFGVERPPYTNTCTQNNYKFEGKERDSETGNDDFGARYYSNRFGRWLSSDWSSVPAPVPYANFTNPQTLNLYAMVHDDPETFADLDGHCPVCIVIEEVLQTPEGEEVVNWGAHVLAGGVALLGTAAAASGNVGTSYPSYYHGELQNPDGSSIFLKKDTSSNARGRVDKKTKQEVKEDANGKCEYCGRETQQAEKSKKGVTPPDNEGQTDHYDPNGTSEKDNLAHACRTCNRAKSDSDPTNPNDAAGQKWQLDRMKKQQPPAQQQTPPSPPAQGPVVKPDSNQCPNQPSCGMTS